MSVWRIVIFVIGAAGVGVMYLLAGERLPGGQSPPSAYGQIINHQIVPQRHATDAVTAVNFDYRGFDTIGEEFILFVSVMGTLVILREAQEKRPTEKAEALDERRDVGPSDALRVWTLGMTGPTVLFGLYIVAHGQLTPGGGFQGGVILATAPLLIYLAESFGVFKRIASHRWLEIAEATGAGAYIVIGMLAWFAGKQFLTNVLPLGKTGEIFSSGTIFAISLAVGLEVAGGFVLLLYAFLQETLAEKGG